MQIYEAGGGRTGSCLVLMTTSQIHKASLAGPSLGKKQQFQVAKKVQHVPVYITSLLRCQNFTTMVKRERERKFNLSIQPALAYEDVSMLESSAKLRMAAKQ